MNVFLFGDNIDTDVIIPARYLTSGDPETLAAHCMEDIDPTFADTVRPGDIVVAGHNFGCGSSREHAPLALKACGLSCVVAKSFARIFYRNAVNIGLPILECSEAADGIRPGDEVAADAASGTVRNVSTGAVFAARPLPAFVRSIIAAGGLLSYMTGEADAAQTPSVRTVVKKAGHSEPFDEAKLYFSIAQASDSAGKPLPDANIRRLVRCVGQLAWDNMTTAELRGLLCGVLREDGHGGVADAYDRS